MTYQYDSWGNIINTTDTSGVNLAQINPFRYRSYYYDSETDLYYLNSRYYNPAIGRFITADGQLNSGLLGNNLYIYCGDNPVAEIDPYGNHWYDFGREIKSLWAAFIDYGYNTAANEAAIEDPGTNLSNFILDSNPEKDVSVPENDQLLVSFIGQIQLPSIVLDASVTGSWVVYGKVGISEVIDSSDGWDKAYYHYGYGITTPSFPINITLSAGLVQNVHQPSDYDGWFLDFGASAGLGGDYCVSPNHIGNNPPEAYSFTLSPSVGGYIGFDYYKEIR